MNKEVVKKVKQILWQRGYSVKEFGGSAKGVFFDLLISGEYTAKVCELANEKIDLGSPHYDVVIVYDPAGAWGEKLMFADRKKVEQAIEKGKPLKNIFSFNADKYI